MVNECVAGAAPLWHCTLKAACALLKVSLVREGLFGPWNLYPAAMKSPGSTFSLPPFRVRETFGRPTPEAFHTRSDDADVPSYVLSRLCGTLTLTRNEGVAARPQLGQAVPTPQTAIGDVNPLNFPLKSVCDSVLSTTRRSSWDDRSPLPAGPLCATFCSCSVIDARPCGSPNVTVTEADAVSPGLRPLKLKTGPRLVLPKRVSVAAMRCTGVPISTAEPPLPGCGGCEPPADQYTTVSSSAMAAVPAKFATGRRANDLIDIDVHQVEQHRIRDRADGLEAQPHVRQRCRAVDDAVNVNRLSLKTGGRSIQREDGVGRAAVSRHEQTGCHRSAVGRRLISERGQSRADRYAVKERRRHLEHDELAAAPTRHRGRPAVP